MRTPLVTIVLIAVASGCAVSTQDEPEQLGTPPSGSAPIPTVTQRPDHPPVSVSSTTPATSTGATPSP